MNYLNTIEVFELEYMNTFEIFEFLEYVNFSNTFEFLERTIVKPSPPIRVLTRIKKKQPLYITIDEHQFEIPFHHWWLYPNEKPCIQSGPEGFEGTHFCVRQCVYTLPYISVYVSVCILFLCASIYVIGGVLYASIYVIIGELQFEIHCIQSGPDGFEGIHFSVC